MAKGLNRASILGFLGADPETRYTTSGSAVTVIRVATTESWKDKDSGQQQERTEWHRVKFFGRLAEIAGEYLKKGRQVFVEGALRTEKYSDKEGIERYATFIVGSDMQMLGAGAGQSQPRGANDDTDFGESGTGGTGQGQGGARHAPAQGSQGVSRGAHNNNGNVARGSQQNSSTSHAQQQRGSTSAPPSTGADNFGFDDDSVPF